jgi:hypothetical protein
VSAQQARDALRSSHSFLDELAAVDLDRPELTQSLVRATEAHMWLALLVKNLREEGVEP